MEYLTKGCMRLVVDKVSQPELSAPDFNILQLRITAYMSLKSKREEERRSSHKVLPRKPRLLEARRKKQLILNSTLPSPVFPSNLKAIIAICPPSERDHPLPKVHDQQDPSTRVARLSSTSSLPLTNVLVFAFLSPL